MPIDMLYKNSIFILLWYGSPNRA